MNIDFMKYLNKFKAYNKVFILFCAVFFVHGGEQAKLPEDIHLLALSSIDNVYKENFKQAAIDAKKIIRNLPNRPVGYFFYAAVLNSHMEYLQSEKFENAFYAQCDKAIAKGEKILDKKPDDYWANFFVAGAHGQKGTYLSRYEQWITAFKHGWRSVVIFKELEEEKTDEKDLLYGIATYDFWRSTKTKMLWWMPGIEDKRDVSIKILKIIKDSAVYTKYNASLVLVDMLTNQKRYAEALKIANSMLIRYPDNLLCWWGKAKIQVFLKKYDEAEMSLQFILKRIREEQFASKYHAVLCSHYLSIVYFNQKRYNQCIKESNRMKSFKLNSIPQKRLERHLKDVDSRIRKAKRLRGKK